MSGLRCASLALFLAGLFAAADVRAGDPPKLKFEVYKDKAGEFRWRLKSANGETLAVPGQGYKAVADAKKGIEVVKKSATDDKIKYEQYEDEKKQHRWRLKAANGQTVATSSEGYKAKADVEKVIDTIKKGAEKAEVVEVKEDPGK